MYVQCIYIEYIYSERIKGRQGRCPPRSDFECPTASVGAETESLDPHCFGLACVSAGPTQSTDKSPEIPARANGNDLEERVPHLSVRPDNRARHGPIGKLSCFA
jgi:hypothetical protein